MSDDYEREAVEAFNAQEPVQDPHVQAAQAGWKAAEERHQNSASAPNMDWRSPEQKRADEQHLVKVLEESRLLEQAKATQAQIKATDPRHQTSGPAAGTGSSPA